MTPLQLARAAGSLSLIGVLASCAGKTDPRLEQLSAGIGKDSVLKVMGAEKPEKATAFLIAGSYIEAMYFPVPGATDSAGITDRKMSPVIVIDGKLVAWGWKQWDSLAAAHNIPVAPK